MTTKKTVTIPRAFRCEVKVGGTDKEEIILGLRALADLVSNIPEDLQSLKLTGVLGPDGAHIKVVKSPIETVTSLKSPEK